MDFALGGIQSPPDYRDVPLAAVGSALVLAPSFIIDVTQLPVWNQHRLGACGGHAEARLRQKQEQAERNAIIATSPRFAYGVAKCIDGTVGEGTWSRILFKVAKDYGCATEATCPNDTTLDHATYVYNFDIKQVPQVAFDEAKAYSIKGYGYADMTVEGLKQAIVTGTGAVLLAKVGNNWFNSKGYIPPSADFAGNHFIYLFGYADEGSRTKFYILNSWGASWGNNGTGWFYYDEMEKDLIECGTNVDLPDDWLTHVQSLPPAAQFSHNFTADLKLGMKSDEVRALQIALKIEGTFPSSIAETGYFGPVTQAAVIGFQHKYGLTPAVGFCGPLTRQKLNSLYNK